MISQADTQTDLPLRTLPSIQITLIHHDLVKNRNFNRNSYFNFKKLL